MKNLLIVTQKVDSHDQLLGFFVPWLRRFALHFSRVTVLCLERGEYDLPDSIRVVSLGKDRKEPKLRQLWNFYRLTRSLRREYDAVLVHMNPIWVVLGAWWWHLLGKPVFLWYTHKAVTWKLSLAERWADRIFTASRESFRIPSKKAIVTGHGIDTDFFKPDLRRKTSDGTLRILSVGRIAPVKNYGTLIQAVKILYDRHVPFSVTMVGEPALPGDQVYERDLKSDIERLGLKERFHFMGKVRHGDLAGYYQSHDIFVHLSKTGSLDKSILEAMACGMNVVSSNDASRAFLASDRVFDDENPEELAEKIAKNAHTPPAELREYVIQNHNLDTLIRKISEIISDKQNFS